MRRIFESKEYLSLSKIETMLTTFSNEYGSTGCTINARLNKSSLIFFFDKKYTEAIRWSIKNLPERILPNSKTISEFFTDQYVSRDGEYYIMMSFEIIEGTNLIELNTPIDGEKIVKIDNLTNSIPNYLSEVYKWIDLSIELYKFSTLDVETLSEIFSDMFDDAEDYSIYTKEAKGLHLYELVISTSTINEEGGFITIDKEVQLMFRDLPNVISHLQSEYPVRVSINTSKPSKERHPDKSDTFYKSQAFILRIVPTVKNRK